MNIDQASGSDEEAKNGAFQTGENLLPSIISVRLYPKLDLYVPSKSRYKSRPKFRYQPGLTSGYLLLVSPM